jgi:hypothetical protein
VVKLRSSLSSCASSGRNFGAQSAELTAVSKKDYRILVTLSCEVIMTPITESAIIKVWAHLICNTGTPIQQ